jgi:hypothetical protein
VSRRLILLMAAMGAVVLLASGCGGGGSQEEEGNVTEEGKGKEEGKETAAAGQVKVLYEDDAIKPENRDVVEQIRKSGVLERLADWTNEVVTLPHDMEVRVTDDVPEGVTDQSTEPDGRTIWIPASFLTETHKVLAKFVEEVESEDGRPTVFPRRSSTPTTSTCWRISTSSATRWATR